MKYSPQEQRKFAMKTLHDIGFGSAALEVRIYLEKWNLTSKII